VDISLGNLEYRGRTIIFKKILRNAEAEVIGAYKRGNVETLEYDSLMENSTIK
jgi:hypothetical protein